MGAKFKYIVKILEQINIDCHGSFAYDYNFQALVYFVAVRV